MIDWEIVRETTPAFLGGLQITLLLLLISTSSGFILSVPLAMRVPRAIDGCGRLCSSTRS